MKQLDGIFNPGSVTVVGASSRPDNPGTLLLRALKEMGFEGPLYPVNPNHPEIQGLECFPSLLELPGPPGLVILSVPPGSVPRLVKECVETGAEGCVVNTAGFSELGSPEGTALEREILQALDGAPMRLVGPNCMGIYSSTGKLASFVGQRPGEGKVSCISQSGSIANFLFMLGMERGVAFSKIVSSGNELDLNCSDFLEFFSDDEDTEMIFAYLEEVRDAARFLEAASGVRGKKPLLVWRAGLTNRGARAASSHTGAIAGSPEVWEGAVRQAGILPVDDLSDAIDLITAFNHLPPLEGRRVCVISAPGGIAVNAADMVERSDLQLPRLAASTVERLADILPSVGTVLANPVDMGFGAVVPGNLAAVIKAVAGDGAVDVVMVVGGAPASRKGDLGLMNMHSAEIRSAAVQTGKPLVVIGIPSGIAWPFVSELCRAGIPSFLSPQAACRTLERVASFYGV